MATLLISVPLCLSLSGCNQIDAQPRAASSSLPGPEAALLARAQSGDAEAQRAVAAFYLSAPDRPAAVSEPAGEALALDPVAAPPEPVDLRGAEREAHRWLLLAAQQEDPKAQLELGRLLANASSPSIRDVGEGRRQLQQAGQAGEAEAFYLLGEIARDPKTADTSPELAVAYYRRAAEAGISRALVRLGEAYALGQGVDADVDAAEGYYRRASEAGEMMAHYRLARLSDDGVLNDAPRSPDPQKMRDPAHAAHFYRLAAELGHAESQARLGVLSARGEGVIQRYDEAVKWSRLAAEQGDAEGCNSLAVLYLKGLGVEQDFNEAVRWYRKAGELDHAAAQNMLGTIYLTGQGVAENPNEAEHWWRRAAEQGYAAAQYNLGGMFSRGLSTTLSEQEAEAWLEAAAAQGHRSAARELAELTGVASLVEDEATGEVEAFEDAPPPSLF